MSERTEEFFNAENKMAFIDTLTTTQRRDLASACFHDTAPFEQKYNRDICTFSEGEATSAIKAVYSTMLRSQSRKIVALILDQYYTWCLENKIPGAIGHKPLPEEVIHSVNSELLIFSPAHLQSILDRIYEPESEDTVDNTYRCYHWMAYAGLSTESIISLKAEHIHLAPPSTVSIDGEFGVIYSQGLPCIQRCVELKQFRYKHPLYLSDTTAYKNRVPGDYILRGTRGSFDDPAKALHGFRTTLSRRSKAAGVSIGYSNCYYSGLFYRIRESEILYGEAPDFINIASTTPAWVHAKPTDKHYATSERARLYQIARRLRSDYSAWKKELNNR